MAHASCNPLVEFRILRTREEPAVIIPIPIRVSIRIRLVPSILVLAVVLLLLAQVYEHQQSRCQPNDEQTFQHAFVNVKLQVIVVAIVMLRLQASRSHEIIVLISSLVELLVEFSLVVLDKGCDPLAERTAGFGIYRLGVRNNSINGDMRITVLVLPSSSRMGLMFPLVMRFQYPRARSFKRLSLTGR